MKIIKHLLFGALLLITLGCSHLPKNQFEIEGTALNVPDSIKKMYIMYLYNNDTTYIDSSLVINGKFAFKGKVQEPTWAKISDNQNDLRGFVGHNNTLFYIEPTKINAVIDFKNWTSSELSGSVSNQDWEEIYTKLKPIWKKIDSLWSITWQPSFSDSIFLLRQEEANIGIDYFVNHPKSYVGLLNISYIYTSLGSSYKFYDEEERKLQYTIDSAFALMPEYMKNSIAGDNFKSIINGIKISSDGHYAPDFHFKDINGKDIILSEFKNKDCVLLDFWASWCGPCRADIPFMKELYTKYKSEGLEIIGISIDAKQKDWGKAVNDDGSDLWIQVIEPDGSKKGKESVIINYAITSYPTKILIDKNGIIIGRWSGGGEETKIEIEKVLKENIK